MHGKSRKGNILIVVSTVVHVLRICANAVPPQGTLPVYLAHPHILFQSCSPPPLLPLPLYIRSLDHLVVLVCAGSVSDDLHASNHLTHSEEADGLGGDNTDTSELLAVHAAELAERCEGVGRPCCAGVLHGVD